MFAVSASMLSWVFSLGMIGSKVFWAFRLGMIESKSKSENSESTHLATFPQNSMSTLRGSYGRW